MSEVSLKFWLIKFVAEVRRADGKSYPPNSVYLICCGHGYALCATDQTKIDIFKSPGFARLHDTLDSCMKELKLAILKWSKPSQSPVMLKMWCGRNDCWVIQIHKLCLAHLRSISACTSCWEATRSTDSFVTHPHSSVLLSHHVESPIWCTKRMYPKQTREGLSIWRRALWRWCNTQMLITQIVVSMAIQTR